MQNLKVEKDINTPQKMQQQKQRLVRKLQKDFQKWCKTNPIPTDAEQQQKQREMQEWLTALDKAYQIYPTIDVHQIYEYLPLNKEGRLAQNQIHLCLEQPCPISLPVSKLEIRISPNPSDCLFQSTS